MEKMIESNKNGLPPFEEFYKANKGMVYHAIREVAPTLTGDEEALQLALIVFWRCYETYDGQAEFSSLFYTAVRRRLAQYMSKQYSSRVYGDNQNLSYEDLAMGDDGGNEKGVKAGSSDLDYLDIDALFRPLEPREREFCRLRYQGLTLQEIAEKFGISKQRVSVVLASAKTKIEKYMEG